MHNPTPAAGNDKRVHIVDVVRWMLIGFTLCFAVAGIWIRLRFGAVLLDQVLLNLPVPGGGSGFGDTALAIELVAWIVLPLLAVVAITGFGFRRARRGGRIEGRVSVRSILLPLLAAALSFGSFLSITGVPQYVYSLGDDRSVEPYYVTPAVVSGSGKHPNLITIYLESIENTFSDEHLFGENLLADLDRATADWSSYPKLEQPPSGGWTMAGIVATQCGVALKSDLLQAGFDPNETGERLDAYLPGATCLGDLLKGAGYTNTYLGGAAGGFAGKDKYFTSHGYQTVRGLEYWRERGEPAQNISNWGLSDQRLFSHAADVVDELHASGQPFNLTLLTLDTHEPFALRDSCDSAGRQPAAAVTKCSMQAVAGFIDHLRHAGYLKDTVVILTGDHLRPTGAATAFHEELSHAADRTVLFRLWSPRPVRLGVASGDQFSVLPTTLEALGFAVADGRAGLGLSLLGERPVAGVVLALPADEYRSLLTAPSRAFYARLWSR